MSDELKAFATKLGLPEDATADQIAEKVAANETAAADLVTAKAELDELKAAAGDKTEIDKLRDELETVKAARLTDQRDAMLAKAVEDHRIDPAMSIVLAEQFGTNVGGLEKVIAASAPKPAAAHGTGGAGRDSSAPVEAGTMRVMGSDLPVEEEGAKLDAKAKEILATAGKLIPTSQEYFAALKQAETELAAA